MAMSVYLPCIGSYQDVGFVGTHLVAVDAADAGMPLHVVCIKQYGCLLAVAEGHLQNLLPVGTYLAVAFAIVERVYSTDSFCGICAIADFCQAEVVCQE